MAAYAYFDQNGNLLEFISDKSLRQGNENAGNQILVFMEPEDFNYEGKSLSCAYKDKNLDIIITDVIDVVQNIDTQVVPTFKDYDPTHFVSGKSYPFIVVDVPNLVLQDEGSKILSLALIELNDQNQEVSRMSYNSVITFYVDESVIQFTQTITKSEFDYLLAKIGEIASEVIEVSHIIYKVNSKSDLGTYTQWNLNQCFFVLSHSDYSNHPVLLKRGASGYELLFDLANYYTKSEIDTIRETLQGNIDAKQDKLTTALATAKLQYAVGFDEQGNLRKGVGGGGGGGAIYTAGTGISIDNFEISIDDTVVATKTFLSETYETITHASTTYATKTELETVKKNAFIKVNTTTYPTLASFLLSTGEEGYIYLYPIDTTDLTKGYYQYIWEDNAWLGIGSTRIDLSNYVDLDTAQTITGVKTFQQQLNATNIYSTGFSLTLNEANSNLVVLSLYSTTFSQKILPSQDNSKDIGENNKRWNDLYLSGKIKDGTYEVSVADISNGLYGGYASNSTTQLEYETINNITLSADTTYTLASAPNNTYPEYKGYITNSSGSAKVITLPTSITKIKASSSLTVVQPTISGGSVTVAGTVSIPDGAYVEFNLQNGLIALYNWNEQ